MWIKFNENPLNKNTGDCVIRAIVTATGCDWDTVYWGICESGADLCDWGNNDDVWWDYLMRIGWKRKFLPDHCPLCYTVEDFCREFPYGNYILGISGHVVAVVDGDYVDTWDSGSKKPIYFWKKEKCV